MENVEENKGKEGENYLPTFFNLDDKGANIYNEIMN